MIPIKVTNREGAESLIEASDGRSVMEAIKAAGFDELEALCCGSCSCATCHIYVEESFLARLAPVSQMEDELLDSSDHRTGLSRLSCQLKVSEALSGMGVTIAQPD